MDAFSGLGPLYQPYHGPHPFHSNGPIARGHYMNLHEDRLRAFKPDPIEPIKPFRYEPPTVNPILDRYPLSCSCSGAVCFCGKR